LLFPERCVGCGRGGSLLCAFCLDGLLLITPPICPRCGRPQSDDELCSGCDGWQAAIYAIRSPYCFEGAVRQAVHQLKYNNLRAIAPLLGRLMMNYLTSHQIPGEVLVPVPLHRRRLRERGYNQCQLLAKELGKLAQLPVVDDCLVRVRSAPPQARSANVEERRDNVLGVFACRDDRLKGKQVLLIDDVATSGATLNACAVSLKESGAKSVWGLTLAREI